MNSYRQNSAEQLYALLPEIFRDRDKTAEDAVSGGGHLLKYFNALGHVLDLSRHTLEQYYDDRFPDTTVDGHRCQDWLLPYFADLLAVNLYSPYPDGQRQEVANAVRWAQRKGTLQATEEIVEAITQSEGEIQEGWKRVATTARIGLPLLSAMATGEPQAMAPDPAAGSENATAQEISRHPAIRAVTPDLRQVSRAVKADSGTPASRATRFGWSGQVWPQDDAAGRAETSGAAHTVWRQANPHGTPCFPGSYEDSSLRTVDMRDVGDRTGRYHPKRLLIYLPPPFGMCTPDPLRFVWSFSLDTELEGSTEEEPPRLSDFVSRTELDDGTIVYRNTSANSVEIIGDVDIAANSRIRLEKIRFANRVRLSDASVVFVRCAVSELSSELTQESTQPISFKDCLVGDISAPNNSVIAEYVTVLGNIQTARLLASDAIFAGNILGVNADDCVRYTRVPEDYFSAMPPAARQQAVTTAAPDFVSAVFGEPGCGILLQYANEALIRGAEDGGEIGAYHAWRYAAQLDALSSKLSDYLTVGLEPVIVRDPRLLCAPPSIISPE